jgi:hypothetical protein
VPDDWRRIETPVLYRGLRVTVLGELGAGLLAVAGYGTPQELAIAAIAVKRRDGEHIYSVAGSNEWTGSVDDVARAAVRARDAGDAATNCR